MKLTTKRMAVQARRTLQCNYFAFNTTTPERENTDTLFVHYKRMEVYLELTKYDAHASEYHIASCYQFFHAKFLNNTERKESAGLLGGSDTYSYQLKLNHMLHDTNHELFSVR